MNKNILITAIVLALTGCGGSDTDTTNSVEILETVDTTTTIASYTSGIEDLYLIIGQSNAAGRDVEGIDLDGEDSMTNTVKYYTNYQGDYDTSNDDKDDTFLKARQPLNSYSGIKKETADQGVNFGLEFGKSMYDYNNNRVLLVVNARGGSKIAEWGSTSSEGYFENTVTRVNEAKIACACELKGILWHQGEGDVKSTDEGNDGRLYNDTYFAKLEELVKDFRGEFGDVPFLVGQVSQELDKNADLNNDLKKVDDNDDFFSETDVDWVSSINLTTLDGTHFDAESMRKMGRKYATRMQEYVD